MFLFSQIALCFHQGKSSFDNIFVCSWIDGKNAVAAIIKVYLLFGAQNWWTSNGNYRLFTLRSRFHNLLNANFLWRRIYWKREGWEKSWSGKSFWFVDTFSLITSAHKYFGIFPLIFLYVSFIISVVFLFGVKQVSKALKKASNVLSFSDFRKAQQKFILFWFFLEVKRLCSSSSSFSSCHGSCLFLQSSNFTAFSVFILYIDNSRLRNVAKLLTAKTKSNNHDEVHVLLFNSIRCEFGVILRSVSWIKVNRSKNYQQQQRDKLLSCLWTRRRRW